MKTTKIYFSVIVLMIFTSMSSCGKKFLEKQPQGQLTDEQVNTTKGVEFLLTGAYGLMNGNVSGTWGNYAAATSQWLFGDVAGDDAHKGSEVGDQVTMLDIERHTPISVNDQLSTMWDNYYEGVIRCNSTLQHLKVVQAGNDKFSDQRAKEIEAEARMLRGHYYFYLWRVFKNIPYIDETTSTADAAKTPNNVDVLPKIESDFKFAVDNLSVTPPLGDVGRVNQLAAKAYLGKLYLYEGRYQEALPLFTDVIAAKPDLKTLPFLDAFSVRKKNSPGAILSSQNYIDPDGSGDNANVGDMLSGPYGSNPAGCCGFDNPSIDLVNAFRVNAQGLPLFDNGYRVNPYISDLGLTGSSKTNYVVDQSLAFDPRLDYTVGRRGVPYHDWGIMPGDAWIRDPANDGPFIPLKTMIDEADFPGNVGSDGNYVTALNWNVIRLSDVYLMAAESDVQLGNLDGALTLVNEVRERAALIPHKTVNGSDAAAYNVQPYPSFPDKDYAMQAVRFERRIELAMEGQRFFDLVRWGIAKQVLDSYNQFEGTYIPLYKGVTFQDINTIFPIPQEQIDRSGGALKQNPGY